MKIYSNVFDLTQPISRQVYVSPNSVYAFGIKIVKKGIPETDYQLKVFQNGTEIQPMGTIVDGFKLYQRTSPSKPTVTEYDVVYVKGDNIQHLDLVENTTNSTVFDIDQKGGALDIPIASSSVLGGIKVGKNLTIEADGTLNGKDTVEYTAGSGITIAEGSISIDDTVALKTEIPTKTSVLTNDSNFATVSQIPTTVGQLENDAGYINQSDTRDALVIETADGIDYFILHDGGEIETTQSFSRIQTLADQGKIVLSYDFDGKPGRYYVQTVEENAIRFTATVEIDGIVRTRSILLQPQEDDTVSFSAYAVEEIALKRDIPTTTALFEGDYEDGTPFSMNVYVAN